MAKKAKHPNDYPAIILVIAKKILLTNESFDVKVPQGESRSWQQKLNNYRRAVARVLPNEPGLFQLNKVLWKAEFQRPDDSTIRVFQEDEEATNALLAQLGMTLEDIEGFDGTLEEPPSAGDHEHFDGRNPEDFEDDDDLY